MDRSGGSVTTWTNKSWLESTEGCGGVCGGVRRFGSCPFWPFLCLLSTSPLPFFHEVECPESWKRWNNKKKEDQMFLSTLLFLFLSLASKLISAENTFVHSVHATDCGPLLSLLSFRPGFFFYIIIVLNMRNSSIPFETSH